MILFVKNYLRGKKAFFVSKMAYISLSFGFVRKEKKAKLDLPKNYGASQRLP